MISLSPILAAIVALGCVFASARRIWLAANATALHPDVVVDALKNEGGDLEKLRLLVEADPRADWERDLLAAIHAPAEQRVALVNEQLGELDYRLQRWSRVPRVCASMATSFGFLLATLVLRRGLVDAGELPSDIGELLIRGLVGDALTVVAMGVVGTAFCVAAQGVAKRIAKSRAVAADRLVERLEALAPVAL
ncbi:MAG: hypothetical protein KF819_07685 [Labilithrix sp.]|nr:hypothetical protein [Labilithrix sp.]